MLYLFYTMDWELYAWLKRGSRRKEVLLILSRSNNPLTTKEIKLKLSIAMSQASFTIKELYDKKLIECLNPKDKIGKIYKITKSGKELLNEI